MMRLVDLINLLDSVETSKSLLESGWRCGSDVGLA